MNKGPASSDTLQFVIDCGAYVVRGNHDEAGKQRSKHAQAMPAPAGRKEREELSNSALLPLSRTYGPPPPAALAAHVDAQQGKTIVKADLQWAHKMLPQHADFMRELPYTLRLSAYGVLVVHAGG